MLNVKLITIGTLKESYLREAAEEYKKRLGAYCKFTEVNLSEVKLSDKPSTKEIEAALEAEAKQILANMSPRAYKIALCVEGKQLSSEQLAKKFEEIGQTHSEVVLIIGSSFGLSPAVKSACDLRLSVSALTFPHQLMRVILLEATYRAFTIIKGTPYHK